MSLTSLRIGSVFSGIGGFDLAFRRAGYEIVWQCEQDAFCQKILAREFPTVPCHEDVRTLQRGMVPDCDVLVGGFPCQDLSIAGKRGGLTASRSSLFFEFVRLLDELQPVMFVLENVPGFLTSHYGLDFATALDSLENVGFVGAWRTLDSQWFGLAQRRARPFLVGGRGRFGDCAHEILSESAGSGWDSPARDEAGTHVAATLRGRASRAGVNPPGRGGEDDENLICFDWQSGGSKGRLNCSSSSSSLQASQTPAVLALSASGVGTCVADDNQAQAGHLLAVGERERALVGSMHKRHDDDTDTLIPIAGTLGAAHGRNRGIGQENELDFLIANPVTASAGHHGHSSPRGDGCDNLVEGIYSGGVRRLTPLEAEKLQGFPPGWTCLCGNGHRGSQFCRCPDTPRYKALGNAVSVPVVAWIAQRMLTVASGMSAAGTVESER